MISNKSVARSIIPENGVLVILPSDMLRIFQVIRNQVIQEVHRNGVSSYASLQCDHVTSQIFDLVLHIIHLIASCFSMQNRRLKRIDKTLISKPYSIFNTRL